ncbi:hypothetical protein [Anaerorhabdus sp.]|uniref:hypothetical protein n=1 Tax=Anaerorhabdus sp. TaxID=1872524 RepID=UPI002FC7FCFA
MKNFMKTTKGKITIGILCILVIVAGAWGFTEYTKYQEATRTTLLFRETNILGLSEDPLDFVEATDADEIQLLKIMNGDLIMQAEEFQTLLPGEYVFVYGATRGGKETQFKIDVKVIDDEAPVISGAADKEIEYAAEIDLMSGVAAEDNIDGMVEVTSSILNNKLVGIQPVEYTAKDAAGNEAKLMINVTVKQPACAANAIWSGEDCVCDTGYTGDGWSACTVEKKATSSASGSKTTTSSGETNSKGSGSSSTGTSNNNGSTSSNASGGWYVDVPSQEAIDKAYQQGNDKYGQGNSWGAGLDSDGNITNWW